MGLKNNMSCNSEVLLLPWRKDNFLPPRRVLKYEDALHAIRSDVVFIVLFTIYTKPRSYMYVQS